MIKNRRNKNYDLDCTRFEQVQKEILYIGKQFPPSAAYVDRPRGWCIQVWDNATPLADGTPWEGTLRVAIKHTKAQSQSEWNQRELCIPITWDELQAIKDHFWPNRIGLEIYPPHEKIINVAEMRWLWILPPGAVLPLNLGHTEIPLKSQ